MGSTFCNWVRTSVDTLLAEGESTFTSSASASICTVVVVPSTSSLVVVEVLVVAIGWISAARTISSTHQHSSSYDLPLEGSRESRSIVHSPSHDKFLNNSCAAADQNSCDLRIITHQADLQCR